MKKIFLRYSHWLALFIIGFSFISMFINFKLATPDIIAVIMGGTGLLFVGYLTFFIERHKRNREKKNRFLLIEDFSLRRPTTFDGLLNLIF